MEEELIKLKIKRDSKLKVGKRMGNQLWIHKDYILDVMPLKDFNNFKSAISTEYEFNLLRWDSKINELVFIHSPDFNIASEPLVGTMIKVKKTNGKLEVSSKLNPQKDPLIYHHKWTFVKDDFKGFSVVESKQRTLDWKNILGVDRDISNKIGRLSFWNNWLEINGLEKRMSENNEVKNMELPSVWKIYQEIGSDTTKDENPVFLSLNSGKKVEQKIPSAKTARLQRPKTVQIIKDTKLYKKLDNGESVILLDVGCGSGNEYFKSDMESLGVDYNGCDLYNKTRSENLETINKCKNGGANIVTLNNVLNTIAEKDVRKSVMEQCKNGLNEKSGMILILTYEGEKSAQEKRWEAETGKKITGLTPIATRDGWQNRMKTTEYMKEVESVFPNVSLQSINGAKVIVASVNPSLNLNIKDRISVSSKLKI